MGIVRFPPDRAGAPALARLRCAECGAAPMIYLPGPVHILAFCGPLCAAGCGVEPWASADLAQRATWRDRSELEATG